MTSYKQSATARRSSAVGYVRVSTDEQAERGYGLAVQRERIEEFCKRDHMKLVAVYEDPGVSGATALAERPGLSAALRDAGGLDALVVARFDRLARETLQALLIEREFDSIGVRVLCADGMNGDEDSVRLMRSVLYSFAEYEKRQLVARLAAARRAKAQRGGYAGGRPPFGYRARSGSLIPDDDEAEVVRWIFSAAVHEHRTVRQIAAALTEANTLERHWRASEVHRILTREDYKRGTARVVDPKTFNRAAMLLAGRRKR